MTGFVSGPGESPGQARQFGVTHPIGSGARETIPIISAYSSEVSGISEIDRKAASSLDFVLEFVQTRPLGAPARDCRLPDDITYAILEQRQGLKVCAPEEIAFRMGFIDLAELTALARAPSMKNSSYGAYLQHIAEEAGR